MLEEFLNYLRFEKNRSELTVNSYGDDLKAFERYFQGLGTQITWESVDSDVIRGWMEDDGSWEQCHFCLQEVERAAFLVSLFPFQRFGCRKPHLVR